MVLESWSESEIVVKGFLLNRKPLCFNQDAREEYFLEDIVERMSCNGYNAECFSTRRFTGPTGHVLLTTTQSAPSDVTGELGKIAVRSCFRGDSGKGLAS